MLKNTLFALACLLGLAACQSSPKTPEAKTAPPAPATPSIPRSPDEQYGAFFADVQMARVFPDGKTFADCTPKFAPEEILKRYAAEKTQPGFDLKTFVLANFEPPVARNSNFKSDLSRDAAQHIMDLWPVLTRPADSGNPGTLLPLPKPYVVPGGRFGEIYYWDSYFTMLGLQVANRQDLIRNMVENFAYLIDTYGHIPNGNRSYYLSRSQPPFFSLMVGLLDSADHAMTVRFLPQLEKEYQFWMEGADQLTAENPVHRRVVRLADGTILNRYWDDHPAPRPEAYREDYETAQAAAPRPAEEVYRHLKAGAESGIDFSSRWFADGKTLTTIETTDMIPPDLNALLWNLENALAQGYAQQKETDKAAAYAKKAEARAAAVQRICWNEKAGWFEDYNWKKQALSGRLALAGMYPLFFKLATPAQAAKAAKTLEKDFLKPGGLVTTPNHTGQQWDAPNGWAPLQWMAIGGLRAYGMNALANDIKKRWVDLNVHVYQRTGKMLEKYNVEDLSLEAGGGEYPVQDGFGWTNGVLLRLLSEK